MLKKINSVLEPYKHVLTLILILVLGTLIFLTYKFVDQQEQIVDTCGYTSGEIRCVCTEDAWNEYYKTEILKEEINISLEG